MKMDTQYLLVALTVWFLKLPMVKGDMPGTYYWRPRLGIDLAIPTTDPIMRIVGPDFEAPSEDGIRKGKIVLIDSYGAGIMMVAIASGLSGGVSYMGTLSIINPAFYTNAYRWFLRFISQIPLWGAGVTNSNFCETTKVWPRRFFYMDVPVPQWLQDSIFWIKPEAWKKEREEYRKFKKYAETAFGPSFRWPSKRFTDWASEEIRPSQRSSNQQPPVPYSDSQGHFAFRRKRK